FDGLFTLQMESPKDQVVSLVLTNTRGVTVWSKQIDLRAGTNLLDLEIPGLAPGLYMARLEGKNFQSRVLKMVRK
nr:T9SS type A sorting domain-containing protein [Sphingomonadales bacterium]